MENGANGECLKIAGERSSDKVVEFCHWDTTTLFSFLVFTLAQCFFLFGYNRRLYNPSNNLNYKRNAKEDKTQTYQNVL